VRDFSPLAAKSQQPQAFRGCVRSCVWLQKFLSRAAGPERAFPAIMSVAKHNVP